MMKTKSLIIYLFSLTILIMNVQAQEEEKTWSNTPFEVKTIEAQKALVIKADVAMSEIGPKMGDIYKRVFTYLAEKQIQAAGPAVAVYLSWDPEGNTVFEAGVPVAQETKGEGDIIYKEYAEMKVVATLYKGSYENLGPIYGELQKYMTDNSLEPIGISWEVYLTDPSKVSDPSMNQTMIYFPIK